MKKERPWDGGPPPHPRREPRFDGPLTAARLRTLFRGCADFAERTVLLGGDPEKRTTVFLIEGQVRAERLSDFVLRPLATSELLRTADRRAAPPVVTGGADRLL